MRERVFGYLTRYFGEGSSFRDGQFESIASIINDRKALIVQKTGWGKSLVYFFVLKYLKEQKGSGVGIIITPLLSLMRDQEEKASEFDLVAGTIRYDQSKEENERVRQQILNKSIDILFVSPERFANQEFMNYIFPSLDVLLFVIDEAHCISDWGHDFRPDYMRLVNIFSTLPSNTPLVLTTATANDRVVNDIAQQFGDQLKIIRGPLARKSLQLQVIELPEPATRLAWLKDNLKTFDGSGIIYTSTIRDTDKVANWLKSNGINVLPYHSNLTVEEKIEYEKLLLENKVKALVATVALGMGFDKGDLAFVIHFQAPGSLVSYYQ